MRFTVDSSRDITDLGLNLDLMPDKDRTVVKLEPSGYLQVQVKVEIDACIDRVKPFCRPPSGVAARV